MNKTAFLLLLFAFVCSAGAAAKADTTVIINRGRPPMHRPYHHHFRPYAPVMYAPLFVPPPRPRPVVYETTYVQPAPSYVYPSALSASGSSPDFYDAYGRLCRTYQSSSYVYGRLRPITGTACLQPDGVWRTVD